MYLSLSLGTQGKWVTTPAFPVPIPRGCWVCVCFLPPVAGEILFLFSVFLSRLVLTDARALLSCQLAASGMSPLPPSAHMGSCSAPSLILLAF